MAEWWNDIHQGDARETLAEMPSDSVHMAMTSPPYFGLRDYDADGQIGLEDSLDEYIGELVAVFDELRRVLRDDGSVWLNLGDSYGGDSIVRSDGEWTRPGDEGYEEKHTAEVGSRDRRSAAKLGRKNKMLVPHRVAIALQDAGWVVRNDVTWVKPNPMPSSVKDRLNTTTEQIFHLTPEPDYWYDLDAIREPHATDQPPRQIGGSGALEGVREGKGKQARDGHETSGHPAGKNPGDVFEVTTKPFPDAHFAVYPPELCRKPIKATCPPTVCAGCGKPYEREVEQETTFHSGSGKAGNKPDEKHAGRSDAETGEYDIRMGPRTHRETTGWTKPCDCDTDETEAGIALDPFAGAGTTCLVAKQLGRRFVGIDLNAQYVAMAQQRVGVTVDEPERLRGDDETALTAFGEEGDA